MINITEALTTKLVHDTIGNVGALSNALELIDEDENQIDEAVKGILTASTTALKNRLKFFRMTFGINNKENFADANVIKETCQEYIKTVEIKQYPINVDFNIVDASLFKPLCCSLMMLADVAYKGANVKVCMDKEKLDIKLEAEVLSAEKLQILDEIFNKENDVVNAQTAVPMFLKSWLKQQNVQMRFTVIDKQINMCFCRNV